MRIEQSLDTIENSVMEHERKLSETDVTGKPLVSLAALSEKLDHIEDKLSRRHEARGRRRSQRSE